MAACSLVVVWSLLVLMLPLQTGQLNQCTDTSHLTSVVEGQRLIYSTFLSLQIPGIMKCAQACLYRRRCKSFNLDRTSGICELNLATSDEGISLGGIGSLQSKPESIYSDIEPWNKVVAGGCVNHTCSSGQWCEPSLSSPCHDCNAATECGACFPHTEVSGYGFRSYGCYQSGFFPVLDTLFVDLTSSLDVNNMTGTILECAQAVAGGAYRFFGLQNQGECYVGNTIDSFSQPVDLSQCAEDCQGGLGHGDNVFIYEWIPLPVV